MRVDSLAASLASATTRVGLLSRLTEVLEAPSLTEGERGMLGRYAEDLARGLARRGSWPEISIEDIESKARALGYSEAESTVAAQAIKDCDLPAWRAYQIWHFTGMVSRSLSVEIPSANGTVTWTAARLVEETLVSPVGAYILLDEALRHPERAEVLVESAKMGDPVPVVLLLANTPSKPINSTIRPLPQSR